MNAPSSLTQSQQCAQNRYRRQALAPHLQEVRAEGWLPRCRRGDLVGLVMGPRGMSASPRGGVWEPSSGAVSGTELVLVEVGVVMMFVLVLVVPLVLGGVVPVGVITDFTGPERNKN